MQGHQCSASKNTPINLSTKIAFPLAVRDPSAADEKRPRRAAGKRDGGIDSALWRHLVRWPGPQSVFVSALGGVVASRCRWGRGVLGPPRLRFQVQRPRQALQRIRVIRDSGPPDAVTPTRLSPLTNSHSRHLLPPALQVHPSSSKRTTHHPYCTPPTNAAACAPLDPLAVSAPPCSLFLPPPASSSCAHCVPRTALPACRLVAFEAPASSFTAPADVRLFITSSSPQSRGLSYRLRHSWQTFKPVSLPHRPRSTVSSSKTPHRRSRGSERHLHHHGAEAAHAGVDTPS